MAAKPCSVEADLACGHDVVHIAWLPAIREAPANINAISLPEDTLHACSNHPHQCSLTPSIASHTVDCSTNANTARAGAPQRQFTTHDHSLERTAVAVPVCAGARCQSKARERTAVAAPVRAGAPRTQSPVHSAHESPLPRQGKGRHRKSGTCARRCYGLCSGERTARVALGRAGAPRTQSTPAEALAAAQRSARGCLSPPLRETLSAARHRSAGTRAWSCCCLGAAWCGR